MNSISELSSLYLHLLTAQDREKQNRIHLAGTVEELKKFNSRRRLRAATLAAAAADDEEDEEQPARRAVMLEEANAAGELHKHLCMT